MMQCSMLTHEESTCVESDTQYVAVPHGRSIEKSRGEAVLVESGVLMSAPPLVDVSRRGGVASDRGVQVKAAWRQERREGVRNNFGRRLLHMSKDAPDAVRI